jgi:predicted DNA-binding transcriptional regulator YafY
MGGPFVKTFKTLAAKFLADDYASAYGVKLPGATKQGDHACVGLLERCVEGNRKVLIRYRKPDAEKEYLLHPYKILYWDGFWYVWGKNERDKKLATFRIDRIISAQETDAYFTVDKDAAQLLEEGVNVWMSGLRNTKVILTVDAKAARYIEEKVFFPMQKIIEKHADGSLTIEARISHEREILPTVFRWLPHVRIQEPAALAQKVRAVIRQYSAQDTEL